jgi:hypothetical protein
MAFYFEKPRGFTFKAVQYVSLTQIVSRMRSSKAGNPEYFASLLDQGMLPLDVMKEQLRTFSEQILRVVGN